MSLASPPHLEILATGVSRPRGSQPMRPIVILPSGPDTDQPDEAQGLPEGSILVHVSTDACSVRDGTGAESVGLYPLDWYEVSGWKIRVRGDQQSELEQTLLEQTDWAAPQIKIFPSPDSPCKVPLQCKLPTEENQDFVVGRSNEKTDLPLEDKHISRRHLRFSFRDGRHFVEDLGSSHGTKLNNEDIRGKGPVALEDEDEIVIGKTKISYVSYLCGLLSYETVLAARQQREPGRETREEDAAAPGEPSEASDSKAQETPESAPLEEPSEAQIVAPPAARRRFDPISILIFIGVVLSLVALFCLLQYEEAEALFQAFLEWLRPDE